MRFKKNSYIYIFTIFIMVNSIAIAAPRSYSKLKLIDIQTNWQPIAENETNIKIITHVKGNIQEVISRFDPQNWSKVSTWFLSTGCIEFKENFVNSYKSDSDWSCDFIEHVRFDLQSIFIGETENYLRIKSESFIDQKIVRRWTYKELGAKRTTHVIFGDLSSFCIFILPCLFIFPIVKNF